MLSTNVAAAYADLARLYAERDVAERALAVRERDRQAGGQTGSPTASTPSPSSARPRPGRCRPRPTWPPSTSRSRSTRNRLAALVGAGPDRGLGHRPPRRHGSEADRPAGRARRQPGRPPPRRRRRPLAGRGRRAAASTKPAPPSIPTSTWPPTSARRRCTWTSCSPAARASARRPRRSACRSSRAAGCGPVCAAPRPTATPRWPPMTAPSPRPCARSPTRWPASGRCDPPVDQSRAALAADEDAYRIARLRYEGGLATYPVGAAGRERRAAITAASSPISTAAPSPSTSP